MTLAQYVRRRTGLPLGANGSLEAMLGRAFGARSFAGFWRYWNPIFGYYLLYRVYTPTSKVVPRPVALVVTFLACGALHDAVTLAVRGSTAFLFTTIFAFFAGGVLLGEAARLDLSRAPRPARAAIHLAYLASCILAAYALRAAVPGWLSL
ncbi:MBOAT family O-acyltransferase [Parvularcula dongshanensis]|uniref:Acyltransferase n=1 Tax=Parvularcula dongshanensis TaxID=1173995 RepID=A0A840I6Y0_9PROT|nr:MBOAT family O-acyltransferase [Parvularcula dongshanensis]MBB4659924.1 hypothetical protein [Parvularcula dongshanensis]